MAKNENKTATIALTGKPEAMVVNGHLVTSTPYDGKGRPSASGKNMINASSGGNQPISINDKVHKIGVNCYSAV